MENNKMKKTDLQIFLGERITLSKLSKEAKIQLLNFVQHEADMHQLMALALDGKIIAIKDDATRQIIESRFNTVSNLTEVIVNPISIAKRMTLCIRECKKSNNPQVCYAKCKASYQGKMKAAKIAGKLAGKKAIKKARGK
jgi:hypothetical protein